MQFASPIPLWLVPVVAVAIGGLAYFAYRRPLVPLSTAQRAALTMLRGVTLAAIVFFLCRPVVLLPPSSVSGAVVPILVDVSRSMRTADADGQPRLARAVGLIEELVTSLPVGTTAEIFAIGDTVTPAVLPDLKPEARRSDLSGALRTIVERHRGRRVSGIVLVSDGADTGGAAEPDAEDAGGPPVFTVGVGRSDSRDREILGLAAADPRLDESSVDLRVSSTSRGFGREPFQLRVLANGRLVESRAIDAAHDGTPVDELFAVSPDPVNPTVYTAEIAAGADEAVLENNRRSVLVRPAGRKRRILALEGGPGHEHSFLTRAFSADPALELDTVVRKGKNETGQETFLVQAGAGRAPALTAGFPASREALYVYDALVIANIEGDFFTRAQLQQTSEFVSERGGGLLVFGGRSFTQRGLIGSPIEEALPVELNDRRGLRTLPPPIDRPAAHNTVALTADGENHPVTRLGTTREETRKLWARLPPLAAAAPLGGPRPGASVLAVTTSPGGAVLPLVAVQRYGRGRSMVFGGEASWRWRMLMPADDRSYEYFWRGTGRWLAGGSPDPVTVEVPAAAEPGDSIDIVLEARNTAFEPVPEASVLATLTVPGGETRSIAFRPDAASKGKFVAPVRLEQPGLYRVQADARRGAAALGTADSWFYVGGTDRELADPRLNEAYLQRVARASGGQYVSAAESAKVVSWLKDAVPQNLPPEQRDLWHRPSVFALMVALLSAEWILRRRWGLR